ncbi:MAG: M14-type cytosolic carboxypeptidase [Polyangiaceae bacterium]
MEIDADFDGGSIRVVSHDDVSAELHLVPDSASDHMQWFSFRATVEPKKRVDFRITNAGEATYAGAWEDYRVVASTDGESWFRVPTEYEDGVLSFGHEPDASLVHYAYFAPYPWERHLALLERADASPLVRLERVGTSVEGRPMTLVVFGDEGDEDDDKRRVWINARQHPGETGAEWFMEGVIERLLDADDPVTRALLEKACFYLVPNMNPDGGVLGNHRTNAAGKDLNRQWDAPDEDESPEVFHVRAKMQQIGCDLFLDVHADEQNPYVFAAGCEGNPGYTERIDALEDLFMESLVELDTDFQRTYGYDRDDPGEGDLSAAANWVGEAFDCLSLTLEMPFKDNANRPDEAEGWSPARAKNLGRTTLESVLVCLDTVR